MYIRFSASKEANETQDIVNLRIDAASVSRHRSSNQISEESKVTGIIADNQILHFINRLNQAKKRRPHFYGVAFHF